MPKEYRTIEEVAGPLMLVRGVQNVTYDELGEIELADGEKRRCKVLEIDGGKIMSGYSFILWGVGIHWKCCCYWRSYRKQRSEL